MWLQVLASGIVFFRHKGIKMKRLIAAIAIWALGASFAFAQNPVVTQPSLRTATLSGSSISVTNTFQTVYPINDRRLGCVVQNKNARNMYINFVSRATATISNSALLVPGASAGCTLYGTVLTGEVSITGTATDEYYASQY